MTLEKMGTEFVEKEMRGAILIPTEIKIKQKLSQNRDLSTNKKCLSNFENDKIMAKKND
jgi:transcriptional regulator